MDLSSGSLPIVGSSSATMLGSNWVNNVQEKCGSAGIDLGTTNVSAGVYRGDLPRMLAFENDVKYFPSIVAFPPGAPPLVGWEAKEYGIRYPTLAVTDSKRLMGRLYDDIAKNLESKVGYKIEKASDGYCIIVLTDPETGKETRHRPETIASMILQKVKMEAKLQLEIIVINAVITVPAYFNNCQRKATVKAADMAGINVLRIVNEPTSASIVYARQLQPMSDVKVLVFDLGGGTFDISIVHIQKDGIGNTNVLVKAVQGMNFVGGKDFEVAVLDHVITNLAIQLDYNDRDDLLERMDQAQLGIIKERVREIAEQKKKDVCDRKKTIIDIPQIVPDVDFYESFSIHNFNMLNEPLYNAMMNKVTELLDTSKINKEEIHQVMLVGGSCKIPELRKRLTDYFNKEPFVHSLQDDVFLGAAMLAASHDRNPLYQWINLKDVIAYDIGVKNDENKMEVIVPRYTFLPFKDTIPFQTTNKNQSTATIMLFEGNNKDVQLNKKLGHFSIRGMNTMTDQCTPFDLKVEVEEETGLIEITVKEIWGDKYETAYFDKFTPQEVSQQEQQRIANDTRVLNAQIEGVYQVEDYKNQLHAMSYAYRKKVDKLRKEQSQAAKETQNDNTTSVVNTPNQSDLIAKFKHHANEIVKWLTGPLSQRISLDQLNHKEYLFTAHFHATLRNEDWNEPENAALLEEVLTAKGEANVEVISSTLVKVVSSTSSKRPGQSILNGPSSSSSMPVPLKKIKQEREEVKDNEEHNDAYNNGEESAKDGENNGYVVDENSQEIEDPGELSDTAPTEVFNLDEEDNGEVIIIN